MKYEDKNTLELFFAQLDEQTIEQMIDIYENGDEHKLKSLIESLPVDIPKDVLLKHLHLLKQMKAEFGE